MAKALWITLGIILVLLSVGAVLYFSGNLPVQSITGFSTLSLQQAELRSSSPYFSGKAWILTVRQGGLGQTAEGTFSPSDIQSKTTDEATTKKDFTVNVDYADQQCVYPIQKAGQFEPIKKWNTQTWTYIPFKDPCDLNEASARGVNNIRYVVKPSGSLTCYAVYWTEKSEMGIYGNTDLRAKMTVNIEAGDRSGSKELDTEGSTQGAISDFAYVIWQGNLDTGKSCSYTTDMPYKPAYKNGRWTNVDKQKYDLYVAKYNEGFDPTFFGGGSEVINYVSALNTRADASLVAQNFGSFDNPTSYNSAVLREDIQSPLQYPVLTFYIKAETLGIYTPAPEIELTQASSECFKTGENGIIKINAKNIGDESGVWNFFGDCDGSFDITQSREYGLSAGQEKQVTLPLSATSTTRQTGSCTVYAESPAGTKQINVGVCVDPQQTCTPNQKFCGTSGGSDVIKQCSSSGAQSSILEICGSDETCEISGGQPQCVANGGGGGSGFLDWLSGLFGGFGQAINDFIFKFRLIFAIGVGVIGLLIGWGYSRSLIPMFGIMTTQELSKKMWLPIVLGLLAGVVLGLLAYWYFWIILIVIVIMGVIKIFI